MDFRSTLTGAVTEAALADLLRHAGYAVIRTSIETIVPQLRLLNQGEYARLEISPVLRHLPDLVVIPPGHPATHLEVKFRRSLTRSVVNMLLEKARTQQELHPQTHTIIVRGRAPHGAKARADDHVRILPPRRLELLAAADVFYHSCPTESNGEDERLEPMWRALRTVPGAFPLLQPHRDQLEQLVPLFRTLATL